MQVVPADIVAAVDSHIAAVAACHNAHKAAALHMFAAYQTDLAVAVLNMDHYIVGMAHHKQVVVHNHLAVVVVEQLFGLAYY